MYASYFYNVENIDKLFGAAPPLSVLKSFSSTPSYAFKIVQDSADDACAINMSIYANASAKDN